MRVRVPLPVIHGRLTQLVESRNFNPLVEGSNPSSFNSYPAGIATGTVVTTIKLCNRLLEKLHLSSISGNLINRMPRLFKLCMKVFHTCRFRRLFGSLIQTLNLLRNPSICSRISKGFPR